jgi:HAD superfamily phosphatase
LFDAIAQLEGLYPGSQHSPVVYVGDTVADMQTVVRARSDRPDRLWFAVGVLPPHVLADAEVIGAYKQGLMDAGAAIVVDRTVELTPDRLRGLGI